jgi:alpha(1,3/1,4) fucosyltransferase
LQTLKVNFGYFWPDFKKEDNYFTRVLSRKYKIEISENPDFYFFTYPYNGKRDYLKYKCHRIFLGWENQRADWNICDYVLDSDFYENNPRHKRWPIWALWHPEQLTQPKETGVLKGKNKFCCMVVSNGKAKERIEFYNRLSNYKTVDSGGRFMNNIGAPVDDKMKFISDYKFVISFENSSSPGYTTEKLIEPMLVNSIPIYWGNPTVGKDFNTASFINIPDTNSFDNAIERIIELDSDDNKYMEIAAKPWFNNNKVPDEMTQESLADFLDFVIKDSKNKKPVALFPMKVMSHKTALLKNKITGSLKHRLGINTGFR